MAKTKYLTTIQVKKIGEQYFFRTALPKEVATRDLHLAIDGKKQKLEWTVEKGKVVVEKKR